MTNYYCILIGREECHFNVIQCRKIKHSAIFVILTFVVRCYNVDKINYFCKL